MTRIKKLVYVTKEKLPPPSEKTELTANDVTKISREVKQQMKIKHPVANLSKFIELEM